MTTTPAASRRPVTLAEVQTRGSIRAAAALLGPAFVASAAYVDPGNFATNFTAGAEHGYLLLWVVVAANLVAMLVQYVTSNLGLATGHSLPELCRVRFSRSTNLILWMQGEVVAMATDLAEFTGAALGLHMVCGIPLLPAGVLTAGVALAILGLDRRGYRRFELAVVALLGLLGVGLAYLFVTAATGSSWQQLTFALLPRLSGGDTVSLAVAIIGATVMPHVVFLHSALHKDRVIASDREGRQRLRRFNRLDCIAALSVAGLVNVAMLCVAATLVRQPGAVGGIGLAVVHERLRQVAGGGAALVFASALMASGLSSASVGTYSGQVIMAGFMNWRIPLFARRALTMLPSLIILATTANITHALVYSQVVLSFGLPFALVPLVLIARDPAIAGAGAIRPYTSALLSGVTIIITALNAVVIWQAFGEQG